MKRLAPFNLSANTNGGLRADPVDPDSSKRERPEGFVEAEDRWRY